MNRLVVATGGTGGHIFPALAVAAEHLRRAPQGRVLFLGGRGPEGDLARKAGLEFTALPARAVVGKGLKAVLGLAWTAGGLALSIVELRRFRPDAVMGFGGYAGFCPVLAARLLRTPTAIHEQNSLPGITNRLLGKWVDKIFISFADSAGFFPKERTVSVGNPVRPEISKVREKRSAGRPGRNLLILGGSQGARAINDAVIQALPLLSAAGVGLRHQAGPGDEQRVKNAYLAAGRDPSMVQGFIEDMAEAYAWADLVLCRAGATTVFELAASGAPAILVPFPFAAGDHQTKNARALAECGAALIIHQKDLSAQALADQAAGLLGSEDRLAAMSEAAGRFARPDAARDMVSDMENIVARAA
ncbi:MAG: undecaprenyldiphospho-muramoylpentapeptide beta-N-acetylglucosaminyltransferase [Desulfovibrionaceae bacterium]|nr:undecaprenyldiphospho-muramoylpentapeptide beta-N-acetylglucosaminyltransferase [Desulfovibrionaceae bacterium]